MDHIRRNGLTCTASEATGGVQSIAVGEQTARHTRLLIPVQGSCVLHEFKVRSSRKTNASFPLQPATNVNGTLVLTGGNWKLQCAKFVRAAAEQIASLHFDDSQWLPATVPGTVLGSYVALGAVPDPWFGDQMSQISEEFFSRNDFWFHDTFAAPFSHAGKRTWLHLDGINWKAEIFSMEGTSAASTERFYADAST